MRIKAVIFDMDGLLLDTEPVYIKCLEKAVGEYGGTLTNDLIQACTGVSHEQIDKAMRAHFGQDFPVETANRRHKDYAYEHFRSRGVPLKKGVFPLLEALDSRAVLKGLATSTAQTVAESLLEKAGLMSQFSAAVFGDQIERSKPSPDIFLETAARLSVAPADCLVFEDSENGIRAASKAGMRAVLIPDITPPPPEVRNLAFSEYSCLENAKRDLDYLLN